MQFWARLHQFIIGLFSLNISINNAFLIFCQSASKRDIVTQLTAENPTQVVRLSIQSWSQALNAHKQWILRDWNFMASALWLSNVYYSHQWMIWFISSLPFQFNKASNIVANYFLRIKIYQYNLCIFIQFPLVMQFFPLWKLISIKFQHLISLPSV